MGRIYFSRLVSQEIVQVQKYCGKRHYSLLNSCFWKASNNNNKFLVVTKRRGKPRESIYETRQYLRNVGCIAANFAKIFSREDQRARCESSKMPVPSANHRGRFDIIPSESVFRSCLCFIHVKQRRVCVKKKKERDLKKSRHTHRMQRMKIPASNERELTRRLNGPPCCVIGGLRALIRKYCRRLYTTAVHSAARFPNWNDFALADTLSALAAHSWNISSRLYDLQLRLSAKGDPYSSCNEREENESTRVFILINYIRKYLDTHFW